MSGARFDSVFRPDLFAGQVFVVTGGGTGIGRCIAHELASLGGAVVLAGRTLERLEAVRAEIEADGGRAVAQRCDIREASEVDALFSRCLDELGRVDGLVNNGGGQFAAPAVAISQRGFRAVVETNLVGTFSMCKQAFESWMSEHGGAIVNVVADMWRGMPMMAHSGAARAGVVNLTRTLALEWAQTGVRVNAVAPGIIASSGLDNYPEPVKEVLHGLPPKLPAGRLGTESEVSSAVCFLLSPGARYVNGATLRIDGGSSLYQHAFEIFPDGATPRYDGFHRRPALSEELARLVGGESSDPEGHG